MEGVRNLMYRFVPPQEREAFQKVARQWMKERGFEEQTRVDDPRRPFPEDDEGDL